MKTTTAQRWLLAHATVAELRGWQPLNDDSCVLEAVEAVAMGRSAEPGLLWSWRQGQLRFRALLTVQDVINAMDYEEDLCPPDKPSASDWVPLIQLSVYEPHGEPPSAPSPVTWCMDYLP